MNIIILHNEKSGSRNRIRLIKRIKNKLSLKHNVELISFDDIKNLNLTKINTDQKDLIIISGGDSSVSYFVNNLKSFKIPYLVVPTGTGNDFAKSLNLKRNINSVLKTIDKFDVQNLSSIISNKDNIIINFICFGFAAKVNRFANKFPRYLGINKYTIATFISLFGKINETLKFESNEFNENGDYTLAMFVVNSNNFGKDLLKLKNIENNKTHLLLINKVNKLKFLYLFLLLQIGKHEGRKELRVIPITSLKVSRLEGELLPQADGETISSGTKELNIEFEILQFLRN
jgi:diacylglycerol kinase (ATP)